MGYVRIKPEMTTSSRGFQIPLQVLTAYSETPQLSLIQKASCRLVKVNVESPTVWALS